MIDGNAKMLYRYWTESITAEDFKSVKIKLDEYKVISETPAGYWFYKSYTTKKSFVLKHNTPTSNAYNFRPGKRFCYASKELALTSYKIRLRKRIGYLTRDLDSCKIAEQLLTEGKYEQKTETPTFLFEGNL